MDTNHGQAQASTEDRSSEVSRPGSAATTSCTVETQALAVSPAETMESTLRSAQKHRARGDWPSAIKLLQSIIDSSKQDALFEGTAAAPMVYKVTLELAGIYADMQAWKEAQAILEPAIKAYEAVSEPNLATLLRLKTQLASVQMGAGDWAAAELAHREILHEKQILLPDDESEIALSKGDLAVALKRQGQLAEAEELEREVLEVRSRLSEAAHRYELIAMSNLATTLRVLERYNESVELSDRALALALALAPAKQTSDDEHPMTLTIRNDLAITLSRLKRWEDAMTLQEVVLQSSVRAYGADQLRTITAKANLAVTYRNTSRFDEAAELEETVLRVRTDELGSEHPDTLRAMYNLAMTNSKRGHLEAAKTMIRSTVEKRITRCGPDHAETKEAISALEQMERHDGGYEAPHT